MPDQAITKVKNQKEEYIMNNRYKRVLAAVLSIVMLMTVTLSVSVFAEGTGVKVKASVETRPVDGSYLVTAITFDETPAAAPEGKTLEELYGEYVKINGVTLTKASKYAGNGIWAAMVSVEGNTLVIKTSNCDYVDAIDSSLPHKAIGIYSWQDNTIEILKDFPFAGNKTLDADITFSTKNGDNTTWAISGEGLKASTVKVDASVETKPADGSYLVTAITFDETPAAAPEGKTLEELYGDYVKINGVSLAKASKYAGNGIWAAMVSVEGNTLVIKTSNCDYVDAIDSSLPHKAIGIYDWQDNTIEILKGFPFAEGKTLDADITFSTKSGDNKTWTIAGEGLQPASVKVDASVETKPADGSYLVTAITFDETPAAAPDGKTLEELYGDYVKINGVSLLKASKYAGNGIWAAMVSVEGNTLVIKTSNCDYVDAIDSSLPHKAIGIYDWQDNTIEILKGFPFADNKILEADITFSTKNGDNKTWTVSGDGLKPSTEPDPEPKPDDRPAATTDDLVTGVARDQSGSYGVADLFFGKVLKNGDVSANYGDFIKVNGVLLKTGMAYKNPTYQIESIKAFANDNLLQIQTSNCDMANAIDPSLPSGQVVFFSENQDNTIELLAGFPFADGTVLDRNITLTMAKHKSGERGVWTVSDAGGSLKPDFDAKDWTAVDPGDVDNTFDRDAVQDPNAGQKLTMEMLPITVTVDGKEYTTPFLPANLGGYYLENGGYYSGVRIKFNRPLMYKDGDTLLKLMGDKMKIGAKAVDAALSESSRNMDGNGDFVKATLSDDKCELLLLYRWDKISGPWLYTRDDGTGNLTEDKSKWQTNGGQADCSVTLLEGIAYGKGDEVTDYTLRAAFSGGTWSWTVENSGDEPDLTGEKVTVFITDADGVPGITDPVAGQSWLSQVKIVFSHKLYTDDVSEAALIAKYGKYITLNSTTVAALYEQNNPGTGVPHAVTLELVDGGKALLVKCDVTMANSGALVSTSDQLILLDKDFPITSKKTLEEEWAFEYTVESGDWVRLTDDKPDDGKKDDDGKQDDGKTDDGKTDDTPKTGVVGVSAAVLVLTAICGVTVMVTRRKNNA